VNVALTSQRSDDINFTLTFIISDTRYMMPPENIVVANVGGEQAIHVSV
jgi:hypothetical protein